MTPQRFQVTNRRPSLCLVLRGALSVVLLVLAGCGSESERVADAKQRLGESLDKTIQQLSPHGQQVQELAEDELGKLNAIEYRVVELPLMTSHDELEATLRTLGQSRWDCFQALQVTAGTQLLCKRRPASYLRYFSRYLSF